MIAISDEKIEIYCEAVRNAGIESQKSYDLAYRALEQTNETMTDKDVCYGKIRLANGVYDRTLDAAKALACK